MAALEISAGLTSLKTALEIARTLWNISDATERNSKILDLQRAIGEAQLSAINAREAHSAQIDRIHDLEAEIARLKAWEGEKERYDLKAVGHGAVAFVLKESMRGSEDPHWLCPDCFERRQKSYFQLDATGRRGIWTCGTCKAHISVQSQPVFA